MSSIFNNLDIFCIGLIALLSFVGFIRGFLKELASIINWSLTVILTVFLKPIVIEKFLKNFKFPFLADFIANVVLFISLMLTISMITKVLAEKIRRYIPYSTNSSLGFLFGFIKSILIIGSLLACFDLISNGDSPITKKSIINNILIKNNDIFSNVFRELLGEYFIYSSNDETENSKKNMLKQIQDIRKEFRESIKENNEDIDKKVNNFINEKLKDNIEEIQKHIIDLNNLNDTKNKQIQDSNETNTDVNINDVLDNILKNNDD